MSDSKSLSSDLASLHIDRDKDPERKHPWRLIVTIVLFFAGVIVVYLVAAPGLRAKVFKTEVSITTIALISPAQSAIELTSTGYVVAEKLSRTAAKVPGKVATVAVKQGDNVKVGDILFTLDAADQQAAIASAKSRVRAAQAVAAAAKANLAEAELQANREKVLAGSGVSPQARADDLAARVNALRKSLRASSANVATARADVKALEVNLKSYTVLAPISGTVLNKPPEVGEFVGPQPAGISTDMGGIELADFSSLIVETDVAEQRLHLIKPGTPAEIILDAFPGKRYRGKTREVVPKVDRAKATVPVKVAFVDSSEGALPDMSARVSFLSGELDPEAIKEPPKIVVPRSAIVERRGAQVVFVLEGDRVRMATVSIGDQFADGYILLKGPAPNTRLVANPPATMADGQRVKERTD